MCVHGLQKKVIVIVQVSKPSNLIVTCKWSMIPSLNNFTEKIYDVNGLANLVHI